MSMVQYDLMHSATGVLTTFNKALFTKDNPLCISQAARVEVTVVHPTASDSR